MSPAKKLQLLFAACACAATGLVAREGWVLKAQPDPVVGMKLPTACAGLTTGIDPRRTYTEDECLQMTAAAMVKMSGPILACVPDDMPLSAAPYLGEMVSMTHNIGTAGFLGSTMCLEMRAGHYRAACDAILGWYKAGGVDCRDPNQRVCRGLWADRQRQHARCIEAIP